MSEFIIYITPTDAELIRCWVNEDAQIAWIVRESQVGDHYHWRAVSKLDALHPQDYSLWHIGSGALNIPSGSQAQADELVPDPFLGWKQRLEGKEATHPWFGGNLPGPFTFSFRPAGKEAPNSIGRSGFSWLGNRYKGVGKPAPSVSIKWWSKLGRFIKTRGTPIPWPYPHGIGRQVAYAFPEAYDFILSGIHADANP